jgi:hypothetical protein
VVGGGEGDPPGVSPAPTTQPGAVERVVLDTKAECGQLREVFKTFIGVFDDFIKQQDPSRSGKREWSYKKMVPPGFPQPIYYTTKETEGSLSQATPQGRHTIMDPERDKAVTKAATNRLSRSNSLDLLEAQKGPAGRKTGSPSETLMTVMSHSEVRKTKVLED